MKKLIVCSDVYEAETTALELESRGIATFVSGKNTSNIGVAAFGLISPTVNVLFEHQWEDAVKLLDNPNHAVSTALSPEDIQRIKENAEHLSPNFAYNVIGVLALAGMLLFIIVALLVKYV